MMAQSENSSRSSNKSSERARRKRKTGLVGHTLSFVAACGGIWWYYYFYDSSPVVSITSGHIQGWKVDRSNEVPYFAFSGIPYAKPPIGELRFKDPQTDGLKWDGVRKATSEGPICPQLLTKLNTTKIKDRTLEKVQSIGGLWNILQNIPVITRLAYAFFTQNEDCLYLNVYTPVMSLNATKENELRPVLLWIHGGAFLVGDGGLDTQGPRHFMEEDIVVITLNYRLGALGFMNLQNKDIPGNAGAKDVVAALRWVRENIRQFGGDPNRVVVAGNSAGGALSHYLTFSPMAKGLFHGVIAQSGTALHHWTFTTVEQVKKKAYCLADHLVGNKDSKTDDQVFAILKSASASAITKFVEECVPSEDKDMAMDEFPFQLCPEVEVDGSQVFLPAPPLHLLRTNQFYEVPMILGVTSLEGVLWFISIMIKGREQYPELRRLGENTLDLLPEYMREHLSPDSSDLLILEKQIRKFYFGGRGLHEISVDEYLHLYGDLWGVFDTHRLARELVASSKAPVYVYNFTAVGKLNFFSTLVLYEEKGGASHADELGYMWDVTLFQPYIKSGDYEDRVRKNLVAMWANFIRTGEPTPASNQSERTPDIIWPAISNADMPVLRLDHPPSIQSGLSQKAMMFWDDIYRQVTSPAKYRQANSS